MSRATAVVCLAIGLAVGVLLAPTGAFSAASSLVRITDDGTHTAGVTKAHQLLAAESDPANAVVITQAGMNSCFSIYTVPAGRALVLKNATFNFQFSSQSNGDAGLVSGPSCGGSTWANEWATGSATTQTFQDDLGSEAILPSGTQLDFSTVGFAWSFVVVRGYLIPAAAAPNGAHVVSHGSARRLAAPLG
jgi:hypothetical protein